MKVLILAAVPIVGFAVGWWLAQRSKSRAALSKTDRLELSHRRAFMSELQMTTNQHIILGDNYAVIVADMLEEYRRKSVRD